MQNPNYYYLTNPQKSIWLTEEYYKGSAINNICGTALIKENVDFLGIIFLICLVLYYVSFMKLNDAKFGLDAAEANANIVKENKSASRAEIDASRCELNKAVATYKGAIATNESYRSRMFVCLVITILVVISIILYSAYIPEAKGSHNGYGAKTIMDLGS